jgi:hypothetical protein
MWALMWIRTCIVLHNLIIRLEEGRIDEEWREELYRIGREDGPANDDEESESDEDEEGADADLRRARRLNRPAGERFRHKVMDALFDSLILVLFVDQTKFLLLYEMLYAIWYGASTSY